MRFFSSLSLFFRGGGQLSQSSSTSAGTRSQAPRASPLAHPPRPRPNPLRQRGLTLTLANHVASMSSHDDANLMAANMAWFRRLSTEPNALAEKWLEENT